MKRILSGSQFETYGYDNGGNLSSKTDFNGRTTTFAYDTMRRLLSKTPDPSLSQPTISFTYTATDSEPVILIALVPAFAPILAALGVISGVCAVVDDVRHGNFALAAVDYAAAVFSAIGGLGLISQVSPYEIIPPEPPPDSGIQTFG